MPAVFFITHPDVAIDPSIPVPDWPLNVRGRAGMNLHRNVNIRKARTVLKSRRAPANGFFKHGPGGYVLSRQGVTRTPFQR